MATSLIVTTADYQTGKTQQTTFTGVNPAATAAELQTFGEMTAALSKDTFVKATRVEQVDCSVTKPARPVPSLMYLRRDTEINFPEEGVVNLTTSQIYIAGGRGQLVVRIRTPYDGMAPVIVNPVAEGTTVSLNTVNFSATGLRWHITWDLPQGDVPVCSFSFTLHFDETSEYQAFDKLLTFNVTEG